METAEAPVESGDKVKTARSGEVELLGINPEGFVSAGVPAPTAEEPLEITDARLFLGYGGPLGIETPNGLTKAFAGDGLYTLSDGSRFVLPRKLADALGQTLPEPNAEEVKAIDEKYLSPKEFAEKYPPEESAEGEAPAQTPASSSSGGDEL